MHAANQIENGSWHFSEEHFGSVCLIRTQKGGIMQVAFWTDANRERPMWRTVPFKCQLTIWFRGDCRGRGSERKALGESVGQRERFVRYRLRAVSVPTRFSRHIRR